jgi:arylsulfatase
VGRDAGAPVSPDYPAYRNNFSGTVNWVHLDIRGDDYDRDVSPEAYFKAAMARE